VSAARKPDADSGPRLYRPHEVARVLHCSEWWVKEQARRRRIPFSWIGGSYRFTDDHLAEIIRLCEVRPTAGGTASPGGGPAGRGRRRRAPAPPAAAPDPAAQLKARPPARARRAGSDTSAA
jgi:hypothetical protein